MKKRFSRKKSKADSASHRGISSGFVSLISCCALGAVISVIILAILIVIISAFCMLSDNPHKFVLPFSLFALCASAFFGGIFSEKKAGGSALLCGALCGIIFTLLLFILSALISIGAQPDETRLSPAFKMLIIPFSCLGSIVAIYSPQKNKKRRKSR